MCRFVAGFYHYLRQIVQNSVAHLVRVTNMPESAVNWETDSLATPLVALDAAVVRRNIQRMAEYTRRSGLGLRPHTKTHKSRRLAQLQMQAGALGLAVAKVSEADTISDPNMDLLLAYPPVGRSRAQRLAELARDRENGAAVDSLIAIEQVAAAAQAANTMIGLLVDLDVGMRRTGVSYPSATLPLAQEIDRSPHLKLDGIMIYPGHGDDSARYVAIIGDRDRLMRPFRNRNNGHA